MALFTREEALDYSANPRPGKLETLAVKPCRNQKDLSMAYSPGVAEACKAIHADPEKAYAYTGKGNLVAVVSNGSAVLGLGNIGPAAGKPVMEGKGVLFKVFADVDCYDINLDCADPEKICEIVKALEPTFGGINLEDIKAPECFYIEERLKREMNIPVFHDDQHGTAIISGAGLLNALEITGKKIEDIRLVVSGAGAAAVSCTNFYKLMGLRPENIAMFDSKGHIHKGRSGLNEQKRGFATEKQFASLAEAMQGADMFLGLSVANVVSQDMVRSMADSPIIFACANPDPEISYPAVKEVRPDAIMSTGRSDYPNQINNVSGFPYIFRGALDVRSRVINEEMKLAAAKAIAALAKEPVPEEISQAYGGREFKFGRDYVIPTALDPRLLEWVSSAVAEAAMQTGVAAKSLNLAEYRAALKARIGKTRERMESLWNSYGFS